MWPRERISSGVITPRHTGSDLRSTDVRVRDLKKMKPGSSEDYLSVRSSPFAARDSRSQKWARRRKSDGVVDGYRGDSITALCIRLYVFPSCVLRVCTHRCGHAHSAPVRIPRVEQPVHHDSAALNRDDRRRRRPPTGDALCNGTEKSVARQIRGR